MTYRPPPDTLTHRSPTASRHPFAPEPVSARSVIAGFAVFAAILAAVWLRHAPVAAAGVLALAALLVPVGRRLLTRDHRATVGVPGGGRLVVRFHADAPE